MPGFSAITSLPKRVINRANLVAGRYVVGNPRGIHRNLQGEWTKLRARALAGYRRVGDCRDQATQLSGTGLLPLGNPYDPAFMAELRTSYENLISDDHYARNHGNGGHIDRARELVDPHKTLPQIAGLLTPEIIHVVQEYYGAFLNVVEVQAWRIFHLPQEIAENSYVYSQWWHCDNRRSSLIKLFVNLSDVGEEDGPLHVQSIGRTRWLLRHGYLSRTAGGDQNYNLPPGAIEAPDSMHRLVGPAGVAVLANTALCMHRAGIPVEGRWRDIASFYLVPATEPLSANWINNPSRFGKDT